MEFTGMKMSNRPKSQNIHSHRRATHKSSYYSDMQRQTLDTSSQERNPPLKMQNFWHGRLTITEWSNEHYSTITHREHVKGTVNHVDKYKLTFCLYLLTLILFQTYLTCSKNNKKHLKNSPNDSHTIKCAEATILQEKTKTKPFFQKKIFHWSI